jgi:hypothetical protein
VKKTTERKPVLMLRPWLSPASHDVAYAHIEALAMYRYPESSSGNYGDYGIFHAGDDERAVLHLENFRFQCQIDDRHQEAYSFSWGYRPDCHGIFGPADFNRYGPSIKALEKGLQKLRREDGPADSLGRVIIRLARVLRLDGIAAVETSHKGGFRDELPIRWVTWQREFGHAIAWINDLELGLHKECAKRVGKHAA